MRILTTCVVVLMIAALASAAGPATGDWTSLIKVRDIELRLALHVKETTTGLEATFDSIDQKVFGMPVDKIEFKGQQLSFDLTSIQATYKGTLDKAGTRITGTWSQLGMDFPLDFQKAAPSKR
jgi:hypothetical protein